MAVSSKCYPSELRALCGELGMRNPRTYVQSGNLVFEARGSASRWSDVLKTAASTRNWRTVTTLAAMAADPVVATLLYSPP